MSDRTAPPVAATRIIERPGQGEVMLVRQGQLEVVQGPDAGRSVAVVGAPVEVGGEGRDLRLTDNSVSGRHFVVEPCSAGFLLRDLGSTNGTFVEGLRAEAVYLPVPAQIAAGETVLRFSLDAEEVELPLSKRTRFGELLGHSQVMRRVFYLLEQVARSDATVLIEGESGTGKELAAQALHDGSGRDGPFVAVDCGAIPAELIESELFGHRRGAFTGAVADKVGPFEEANRGTLFLDEIGELPVDLQPKLLRALETRTIRRVGESNARPYDARLIAATNRNLEQETARGSFRQDLFFRLSVIRVRMPPLRERRDEIPRLVAHFLGKLGQDPSQRPAPSLMQMLCDHQWPGNVRELRNVVERLALLPGMAPRFYLGERSGAEGEAPRGTVPLDVPFHEGKRQWVERFEREYLAALLARCQGNVSELARVSGLSRQSCHRLLGRYGLT